MHGDHSGNYKMIEIVYAAIKYMAWVRYNGWVLENATTGSSLIVLSLGHTVIVKFRNHEILII